MTREEAKRWIYRKFNSGETEKLMADLIIQALEQEPCEDAISRQAVLEMAYDMSEIDGEHFTKPWMVVDVEDIQKLPPVKPQEPYFWEKCPYYEPDIMFDEKDEYDMGKCTYKQEPCGDDISRHDVECIVEELENICHNAPQEVLELLAKLKNAPFATPYPKTGHWVEENVNGGCRRVFCSECGCPPPFEHISTGDVYSASGYGVINKTKFCPNCGVKMESESDV